LSIPLLFRRRAYRFFSLLSFAILSFAGYVLLRSFFDDHWEFAFDYALQTATWLVYALLVADACETVEDFIKFLLIGVLVQIPVVLYALGHVFNIDFYFDWILKTNERLGSQLISADRSLIFALGNPNFYASYASLLLIWILMFFTLETVRWKKLTWAVYGCIVLFTVVFTFTRGVWVSFIACSFGLLVTKVFLWERDHRSVVRDTIFSKKTLITVVWLAVFFGGVYTLETVSERKPLHLLQKRFDHAFTFRDTSLRSRPLLWFASLRMWNESPVWGQGHGQFGVRFINTVYTIAKESDPSRIQQITKKMNTLFAMRSHNDYLQYLAETGAVGYSLLLLLLLSALYTGYTHGYRLRKHPVYSRVGIACLCIVLFMTVQCAYDFPLRVPATAIWFSVALAGLLIISRNASSQVGFSWFQIVSRFVFALVLLTAVCFTSPVVIRHLLSSHHYRFAEVNKNQIKTVSGDTQRIKYFIRKAEEGFFRARELYPGNGRTLLQLGHTYYILSKIDPNVAGHYRTRAVTLIENAGETFTNPVYFQLLGHIYLDTFHVAKAKQQSDILLLIKPEGQGLDSQYLAGRVARAARRYDDAIAYFLQEVKNNPDNEEAYRDLGYTYLDNLQQYHKAADAFEKRLQINPGLLDPHERLGDIYSLHLAQPEKAKHHYTIALDFAERIELTTKISQLKLKLRDVQETLDRHNADKDLHDE
jgi:O-antigen ligase